MYPTHRIVWGIREDALTSDLIVDETDVRGVALLTLDDAKNIEAVALRTLGDVETSEQLRILGPVGTVMPQ